MGNCLLGLHVNDNAAVRDGRAVQAQVRQPAARLLPRLRPRHRHAQLLRLSGPPRQLSPCEGRAQACSRLQVSLTVALKSQKQ